METATLFGYTTHEPVPGSGFSAFRATRDADGAVVVLQSLPLPPRQREERVGFLSSRLTSVRHPALLEILACGPDARGLVLVTPRYGPSLQGMGPLPPARVVTLARSVLAGLDVLHAAGLYHGLINPSKLHAEEDGAVRLSGLGEVQGSAGEALIIGAMGRFLFPGGRSERFDAPPLPVWDLFGLGVTLYELLAGCCPFGSEMAATPMVPLFRAQSGAFRPISEVAPGVHAPLAAAVHRLLAPRAEENFSSTDALRDALAAE